MADDVSGLTKLGSNRTEYTYEGPSASMLETFPSPHPDREFTVIHTTQEWTSLCPRTGQPDFAEVEVRMVPAAVCVESKSLKLYFFAYRNHGSFMESIVNKILLDLVEVCSPRRCTVTGRFGARGGVQTTVVAEHPQAPK